MSGIPWLSELYPDSLDASSPPEPNGTAVVRVPAAGVELVYEQRDGERCGALHTDPAAICCLPPGHDFPHVGATAFGFEFFGPFVISAVRPLR